MLSIKKLDLTVICVLFILSSQPCSAVTPSACERLKEYYGMSNAEVESYLKEHGDKLLDAEEFSSKCNQNTFQPFNIGKDGVVADKEEMTASSERVRNAAARIKEVNANAQQTDEKLRSFNFAVGIGALYLLNQPDIMNTTVDNGTLRTTSEEKYKLGLWLTTNSFIGRLWPGAIDNCRWGIFTGVQLGGSGSNEILNSFAAGLSFASASSSTTQSKGSSNLVFQFGYGLTRIQTYASGYSDGMTMPTGANQPVMRNSIGKGPVLIVSTFF